ncbi:aspartate 1-decarboxylase autocleavage activator PanM [Pseudomonas sp. CAN2814]|uniref:aspartate 1-decarboxylase autocleavage activator PanM n=1 Tax=Pseudomonas sp. CAN1 TaxID=3046726 RepID=UPI00264809EE|nr:aspartate 1-decarboxylase autocleavage activator PanM [Pseudomonas sp. CAN1]MDN6856429.1 aspartate 1-decarboxylase autocleavage activator PanM [Pseudomonas sp. CAN1]
MPVVVQHLTQPSDQDRQDLLKIYADAPQWLLAPFADAGELVERGLAEGRLFTGRFNDRLLGAAWVERNGDTWRLSRLCVRQVTRNRGVARRLLEESQRLAILQGAALRLTAPGDQPEPARFAAHLGLTLETA